MFRVDFIIILLFLWACKKEKKPTYIINGVLLGKNAKQSVLNRLIGAVHIHDSYFTNKTVKL